MPFKVVFEGFPLTLSNQFDLVKFLTNCLVNIFNNFVPNKTIVCKDKDPLWMADGIKRACLDKAKVYKRCVKNGRTNIDQLSLHNFAS